MIRFLNKKISTVAGVVTVVLVVLIAGGGVYWWYKLTTKNHEIETEQEKESKPSKDESDQNQLKTSELISLDETWYKYINYQLGFSMKIPKNMVHGNGACRWSEDNGDHSYRPDPELVPVKVFEDTDNNIVYITSEYYYELAGETEEDYKHFYSECNKVSNSLERIKNEYRSEERGPYQQAWEIIIKNIANDSELDSFIKERYGSGCSLGDKELSEQEGVYDIGIQGDDKDIEETQCLINYITVLKYYPEKNKVVSWDIGQACTFAGDENYTIIYDKEMHESFRFE